MRNGPACCDRSGRGMMGSWSHPIAHNPTGGSQPAERNPMKAGTVSGGRRGRDMAGNRIGLRVALPAGFHSPVRWDTQLVNGVLPVRTGGTLF